MPREDVLRALPASGMEQMTNQQQDVLEDTLCTYAVTTYLGILPSSLYLRV